VGTRIEHASGTIVEIFFSLNRYAGRCYKAGKPFNFGSAIRLVMNPDVMESFFSEVSSLEKVRRLGDAACISSVSAFIEQVEEFGVTSSHVNVEDCAIFEHGNIIAAIESFIRDNPGCPLPLENITVVRYVSKNSCQQDLDNICGEISANLRGMERFSRQYNIDVRVNVFVQALDYDRAVELCRLAGTKSIDSLYFVFDFPEFDSDSIKELVIVLGRLCADGVLKNIKVNLGNFPFCFLPADKFKYLYRDAVGSLKGHIGKQRDLVKRLKGGAREYHQVCRGCRCRVPCYAYTDITSHEKYEPRLTPRCQKTVAFMGGSLVAADRPADDDVLYVTPAEQGDMVAAVLEGFENILIIDGYFYTKFPCTPFEVMLALEEGINVFGSSSIGALRAVELDQYGITGMGYVYEYLKASDIKPYHIVAQTYTENDTQLTIPLVQVIYFLENAVRENIIGQEEFRICFNAAEGINFSMLSYRHLFSKLLTDKKIEPARITALEKYYDKKGREEFDIKKKDALLLLKDFRAIIESRESDHTRTTFHRAGERYLEILHAKYDEGHNLCLPEGWKTPGDCSEAGVSRVSRDTREFSSEETCRLAREFFKDLDVTVADTTRYDQAGSFVLSAFLMPLYFLDYPLSCATGNGEIFHEALASAFMELVERIPMCGFKLKTLSADKVRDDVFPLEDIPQYYNWAAGVDQKMEKVRSDGYVKATDIISGKDVYVPAYAVMSRESGSDGNAAGNSLAESVLYGIYELIERDTNQIHLLAPDCRRLKTRFIIDNDRIADEKCRRLLKQFEDKGCRVVMFDMPNIYGLPCITTHVYDLNREIQCHGSSAVRSDFYRAVYSALHEAYMQYITYFAGTRDDYFSFFDTKQARIGYEGAQKTFLSAKGTTKACHPAVSFKSVSDELDHVLGRLTSADIRNIVVADTSPRDKYVVKSVKVIIPRFELWFCSEYQPSPFFAERASMTVSKMGLL